MVEQVKQGTTEWYEWRRNKIGASDAAVIMGVSRFKTLRELYLEFVNGRPIQPQSFVQQRGHFYEDIARCWYEFKTFKKWEPLLAVHSQNDRIIASLDGYNEDLKAVLEIKYLKGEAFDKLRMNKKIPIEYFPQLMHQAMVTDCEKIVFVGIIDDRSTSIFKPEKGKFSYEDFEISIGDVERDYINNMLMPGIERFLNFLNHDTEPPLEEKDWVDVEDSDLERDCFFFLNLSNEETKIKKEKAELKVKIEQICSKFHTRVIVGGKYKIVTGKRFSIKNN